MYWNWTEPRYVRDWVARNPLVASFAISLVIHALLFSGWRMGKNLGWWDHQATWLLHLREKVAIHPKPRAVQKSEPQMREIPLSFMEVDPALAERVRVACERATGFRPRVTATRVEIPIADEHELAELAEALERSSPEGG